MSTRTPRTLRAAGQARRLAALLVLSLTPALAAAQTGALAGAVVDGDFGGGLPGASVLVVEQGTGAATDIDGRYRLERLPVGTYTVRYSFVGYATQVVQNVRVAAGQTQTLNITLATDAALDEVVVEAEEIIATHSEVGLLRVRARAAQVSDAISAEAIAQSGASDAGDAMERVTGASVVGGQYVFVRGLGDRYANTQLNGAVLPTADPDRRAVQFDLFPAGFLENIVTLKTFTPDKPGSFSGGLVDINTKSFPNAFSASFSTSAGFSAGAAPGSSTLVDPVQGASPFRFGTGALGFPEALAAAPREAEGSVRALIPSANAARGDAEAAAQLDRLSHAIESRVSPTPGTMPLNTGFSFSMGDAVPVGPTSGFGYVLGLTADTGASLYDDGVIGRADFQGVDGPDGEPTGEVVVNTQQLRADRRATQDAKLGGIANLAYRFGGRHELSLNTLFSHTTESEARVIDGVSNTISDGARIYDTVAGYTERSLGSAQLRGRHSFGDAEVAWRGSVANTELDEPDLRFFTARVFQDDEGATAGIAPVGFNAGPRHYYRTLDESLTGGGLDLTLPIALFGRRGELKGGGLLERTDRGYTENLLILQSNTATTGARLASLDGPAIADFFGPENTGLVASQDRDGDGVDDRFSFGHTVLDQTVAANLYDGTSDVGAAYVMAELPLLPRLRAIAGARYERSRLFVASQQEANDATDPGSVVPVGDRALLGADKTYHDVLPALNLVYGLTDRMNVRAAATRTLARPTFREIAPVVSYEFGSDGALLGNPALERTLITNLDLRWEWFTGPGALLAVSSYYKRLADPIERVIIDAENNATQFDNVDQADIIGAEFEVRQPLGGLAGFLRHVYVGANLSVTESAITITPDELASRREIDPTAGDTRPLQGQASYLLNADLSYENADRGTSAGLYFNVAGRRLSRVGANVDVYEESSPQLDVVASQRLFEPFTLKLSAKNVLDAWYRERYAVPGGETFPFLEYRRGPSLSVGLSFSPGRGGALAAPSIPDPGATTASAAVPTDS